MNTPAKVLFASAAFGLLTDFMLKDTLTTHIPVGLGVPVLSCAAAAAIAYMAYVTKRPREMRSLWFLAPAVLFSFGYIFRDSPTLLMIDLGIVFTGLAFTAASLTGMSVTGGSITQYCGALLVAALTPALNTVDLLMNSINWPSLIPQNVRTTLTAVAKGLAIATPLLLVFFALFAAADPAFAALAKQMLHVDFGDLFVHTGIICTSGWLAAGFLHHCTMADYDQMWIKRTETSSALRPALVTAGVAANSAISSAAATATAASATATATATPPTTTAPPISQGLEKFNPMPQLGVTEMATVLGLLNILFASFVAVQVRYLFGGASLVQLTPGLTYAEYVHRGFTELNLVVALVLPMLLVADCIFVRKTKVGEWLFRGNAGTLIGLVMVILASAMQRTSIYQMEYGQSELRLYVTVFMTWLGSVCAIFAGTVLTGNRQRFAFASYVSGLAIVALLNVANPDAMIAAANIKHGHDKGRFDVSYAMTLSNDAIPTLLANMDMLPEASQRALALRLITQKKCAWKTDLRAFNLSRINAYHAVAANTRKLEHIGGLDKQTTL